MTKQKLNILLSILVWILPLSNADAAQLLQQCMRRQGQHILLERIVKTSAKAPEVYQLYSCQDRKCSFKLSLSQFQAQELRDWIRNSEVGTEMAAEFLITTAAGLIVPGAGTGLSLAKKAVEGITVQKSMDKVIDHFKRQEIAAALQEYLNTLNENYFDSHTNDLLQLLSITHCGFKFFGGFANSESDPDRMTLDRLKKENISNPTTPNACPLATKLTMNDLACYSRDMGFRRAIEKPMPGFVDIPQAKQQIWKTLADTLENIVIEKATRTRFPNDVVTYCKVPGNEGSEWIPDEKNPSKVRRISCREIRSVLNEIANGNDKKGFRAIDSDWASWQNNPAEKARAISPACLSRGHAWVLSKKRIQFLSCFKAQSTAANRSSAM